MRRPALLILIALAACLGACKTVGVSTESGGYAEVSPAIANEMIRRWVCPSFRVTAIGTQAARRTPTKIPYPYRRPAGRSRTSGGMGGQFSTRIAG